MGVLWGQFRAVIDVVRLRNPRELDYPGRAEKKKSATGQEISKTAASQGVPANCRHALRGVMAIYPEAASINESLYSAWVDPPSASHLIRCFEGSISSFDSQSGCQGKATSRHRHTVALVDISLGGCDWRIGIANH